MFNLTRCVNFLNSKIISNNIGHTRSILFNKICLYNLSKKLNYSMSPVKCSPKLKIYTKTGDKGSSSLFTGERRPKNDAIFDALGNADELNSNLGLTREFCLELKNNNNQLKITCESIELKLVKIQSTLLDVGSFIATPKTKAKEQQLNRLSSFDSSLTKELEIWIDTLESELKPLTNFILPGFISMNII
jgi:cob(I)alamin adenosyltransferase